MKGERKLGGYKKDETPEYRRKSLRECLKWRQTQEVTKKIMSDETNTEELEDGTRYTKRRKDCWSTGGKFKGVSLEEKHRRRYTCKA